MASHFKDFMGAKLALFVGGRLLSLQRDDAPGLLWAGHWDLPGGGREGQETPLACVIRETKEELSIKIVQSQITWARAYTNSIGRTVWFLVGTASPKLEARIRLGDEGQAWALYDPAEFMALDNTVPQFKSRLTDYWGGVKPDVWYGKTPR